MVWAVCKPGVAEKIAEETVRETRLGDYNGKFLKISRKTRLEIYLDIDSSLYFLNLI
jgi:sulfoacetaldehyde dehydrogenase